MQLKGGKGRERELVGKKKERRKKGQIEEMGREGAKGKRKILEVK